MTDAEVLHAMSMVFPDVRLKSYVEIRPADSMPVPYALGYAALIKGLFYGKGTLDELAQSCHDISEDDVARAKDALMEKGYAAEVYQRPAAEICDELVAIARRGLPAAEWSFLDPIAELVSRRVTLADLDISNR